MKDKNIQSILLPSFYLTLFLSMKLAKIAFAIGIITTSIIVSSAHTVKRIPLKDQKAYQKLYKEYILPRLRAPLTPGNTYEILNKTFIGAMIENSIPSRQVMSGLSSADIVYESIAEGGITRFLALFETENLPKNIGPIRSVRDYYLDFAEEYTATLVHCGGSEMALKRIELGANITDIDGCHNEVPHFFRSDAIEKPHNLFFNSSTLEPSLLQRNGNNLLFTQIPQKLGNTSEGFTLSFFNPAYAVTFQYNPTTKKYMRFHGDIPHIDHDTNEQVSTTNIVVQYTTSQVLDEKLHLSYDLISGGSCLYFVNGTHSECTWKKTPLGTKYYIENNEIRFADGNLFIELADTKQTLDILYKKS